jgi:hypothetical protein
LRSAPNKVVSSNAMSVATLPKHLKLQMRRCASLMNPPCGRPARITADRRFLRLDHRLRQIPGARIDLLVH